MDVPAAWRAEDLEETHMMLLYMIHLYSDVEVTGGEDSGSSARWVRDTPLLVLIYEGIVAELLDYDYAPASVKVGRRRVFMNITQEGRDDLDDLREAYMKINCVYRHTATIPFFQSMC